MKSWLYRTVELANNNYLELMSTALGAWVWQKHRNRFYRVSRMDPFKITLCKSWYWQLLGQLVHWWRSL